MSDREDVLRRRRGDDARRLAVEAEEMAGAFHDEAAEQHARRGRELRQEGDEDEARAADERAAQERDRADAARESARSDEAAGS